MNQSQQSIHTRQRIHLGLQGSCSSSAKDNSRSLCRANVLAAHINRVFFRETQLECQPPTLPQSPHHVLPWLYSAPVNVSAVSSFDTTLNESHG